MQAVIFDFYGTLAESPSWGPSWHDMVAEAGFELSEDVQHRWWNDGVDGIEHDEHSKSRDHYVAWQQARLHGMLDECGIPAAAQEALIIRAREIGAHRHIVAFDEVLAVLHDLRSRNLTLAICSNWDWDLEEAVASAGLTGAVDVMISSAWIGARKPHPRVYEAVLDLVGVEPAEAVFVGDTWTCDVEGPRAAGLRPIYVRRPHLGTDRTAPVDHHEQDVLCTDDLHAVAALARLS